MEEAVPLSRVIYNRAVTMNVTRITLEFSGGSDEGNLYVNLDFSEDSNAIAPEAIRAFETEVENWAWEVYSYSGAGDGNEYGDNIEYDLVDMTTTCSEWFMERQDGGSEDGSLVLEGDEEDEDD